MKTEITAETYAAENPDAHSIELRPHNLSGLKPVLNGNYGSNVKGRLGYNLNFVAQRVLRETLKNVVSKDAAGLDELIAMFGEDEIEAYFGSDAGPAYTLDQCVEWCLLTYTLAMDVAKQTEANADGFKSKPFHWIAGLVRTPIGMVKHDAGYALQQSMIQQRAKGAMLGIDPEKVQASLDLFEKEQQHRLAEQVAIKIDMIRPLIDTHRWMNLSTESLHEGLEEMCATLGLNIPAMLAEIADKAKDSAKEKFLEGKYVSEPDPDLMSLCSPAKRNVGRQHAEHKPAQSVSIGRYDKPEPVAAAAAPELAPAKKARKRVAAALAVAVAAPQVH